MSLEKLTTDLNIIQALVNEPNDVGGMTADQVKAKFDSAGNIIKDYINNVLTPAIDLKTSADGIPLSDINAINSELAAKTSQISDLNYRNALSKDRFLNFIRCMQANGNPLYIVGDSISEGTASLDFTKDGYANIIVQAINKFCGVKNRGFVNFRDLSSYAGVTNFHTINRTGFNDNPAPFFDSNNFGGVRVSSSVANDCLQVIYTGNDAKVVYVCRADGGTLQVNLDGVNVGTVDTTLLNGYPNNYCAESVPIVVGSYGLHTIKLIKLDNKPTDLIGMIYGVNLSIVSPMVHNVGRSSITLTEIPDNMIDVYSKSGMAILALGVNDQLLNKDINTFKAKLKRFCDNAVAADGSLIICDFMFSLANDNIYELALKDIATQYPQFIYLDFSELWFQDMVMNKYSGLLSNDGIHPTIAGHEFIANTILKFMGLPYTKQDLKNSIISHSTLALNANWVKASNDNFENLQVIRESNDVYLQGIIRKTIASTQYEIIATLPSEFRPLKSKIQVCSATHLYGEIDIEPNGTILYLSGDCGSSTDTTKYIAINAHWRLDY